MICLSKQENIDIAPFIVFRVKYSVVSILSCEMSKTEKHAATIWQTMQVVINIEFAQKQWGIKNNTIVENLIKKQLVQ